MEQQYDAGFVAAHRLHSLPESMYYFPDFITASEEQQVLQKLPPNRWTHLAHRRLQAHPSALSARGALLAAPLPPYLAAAPPILPRLEALGPFAGTNGFVATPHGRPNHCLVNEYRAGEGIMMHEDGGAYAPVVATVSLGGAVVLDVVVKAQEGEGKAEDEAQQRQRILCEPRSLLVTTGRAYVDALHGVPAVAADEDLGAATVANWALLGSPARYADAGGRNERATRVSLTYRDVLRVSWAGGLGRMLGGGGGGGT
ncbi:uncharacterized protein K452DRAFT_289735 [Aplosporella prunicola CBS 121167]|uniref:Fe2OG dioxygenase domain-containing protein n=1 Tax=Aplosporella prunicola CBS 121167 TaxID=1176127 RepID=A0A6A6B6L7_9PEZI|nr:uncharacterized protein K452DRAFT_289735 [Aplosporella prunicola CBS 121167]KAF2139759.1 hypothetical protein K452DRAFT_289735 [Aplosporella prunicola CBS 121167]